MKIISLIENYYYIFKINFLPKKQAKKKITKIKKIKFIIIYIFI